MKNIIISITAVIMIAAVIFSCSNGNLSGYKTADNGTLYKVHYLGNDSTKAIENEIVEIQMSYRLGDSVIFNTADTEEQIMVFPVAKPLFRGDLYNALTLMGNGDSISFAVVADSFYLKTAALKKLPESVTPGSYMYYDLKLLRHISPEQWQLEMQQKRLEESRLEKVTLQNYLNDNKIYTDPTETGLYFISQKKGRGARPDTGDMCQVRLSVRELTNDEILYSNFGERPLDIEYGKGFDTEGFREGLGMLQPGGKATLIVPSWIGVGTTGREVVAPFTTLIYEVELMAIRSLEEVKKDRAQYEKQRAAEKEALRISEPKRIAEYLEENKIVIEPTESGLYFKELIKGEGDHPVDGNTVTIEYIHYNLDGTILQSSYEDKTPFTYMVGTGAVIKGWEEAVKLMRKGGKAWMLLPSDIGYGDYQRIKAIKPYSPLVFELELVEVIK